MTSRQHSLFLKAVLGRGKNGGVIVVVVKVVVMLEVVVVVVVEVEVVKTIVLSPAFISTRSQLLFQDLTRERDYIII